MALLARAARVQHSHEFVRRDLLAGVLFRVFRCGT
jgi:hypothetical protein